MSVLRAALSYARVRLFPLRFRNRAALLAWQDRRLKKWLKHDLPNVAAFAEFAGQECALTDLPVMDKAALMADFSRYTVARISNAQGWKAFEGLKHIGKDIVGASTGTSGNRGLFAISQRERFDWLGAILAKAVPDFWCHRDRIAVMLPIQTPLYDSSNRAGRLQLEFFDINDRFEDVANALERFDPTLIVAPPRILRRIIEQQVAVNPRQVFSAAEKLEGLDRVAIEAGFDHPLKEIYMATEGLLGTTCAQGRLHLAEDCLHFKFEPAGGGLVMPILSDFSRKAQIMARYRLNDLLRLYPRACPCGSPLMVVAEIIGREDDIFCLTSDGGEVLELTPDILRNAILDTDRSIEDFRLVQSGPNAMVLHLPVVCAAPVRDAVRKNLLALLARQNHTADCRIEITDILPHQDGKLRRIKREWRPDPSIQIKTAQDR